MAAPIPTLSYQDPDTVASATHINDQEEESALSGMSEAMTSLQKLMGLAQAIGSGYSEHRNLQNIRPWIGQCGHQWGRQQRPRVEIGFQATPNLRHFMPPDDPEAAARRIAKIWTKLDRVLWSWGRIGRRH